MISSNLAHNMCSNIGDYYSLIKLKQMLTSIEFNRTLTCYDLFLDTLDTSKLRCQYLLISVIDKLVYQGAQAVKSLTVQEILNIFEFIIRRANFKTNTTGLSNIIIYSMIRLIFQPELMEVLRVDKTSIARLDNLMLETSISKEAFLNNINSFPIIYFLQEMITESGDMAPF